MIDQVLLNACCRLAQTIAPELCEMGQPLYIVDIDELQGLPRHEGCLGWAILLPYEDFNLAARLGDRWRGFGPVVVLDGAAIAQQALPRQFARCLLNVMIHELAHVLPPSKPQVVDLHDTKELRELQLNRLQRAFRESSDNGAPGAPGDLHDWRFYRRCLHLWFRSVVHGFDIPLNRLFSSSHLHCTAEVHWLPIILAECIAMQNESFATIESREPPPAFLEQWAEDVARYHHFTNQAQKCVS